MMTWRRLTTIAALLALAGTVTAVVATASDLAVSGSRCARWASPTGDDAARGGQVDPFKTVSKLVASLSPGQVGCLVAGATFDGDVVIAARGSAETPITIETAPDGRRATIRGSIRFEQTSQFVTIQRVVVQGTSVRNRDAGHVQLAGLGNALIRNDITSAPGTENTCVALDHSRRVRIDSNTIHDCGKPPLYAAGVFAAVSVATRIENNFIYSNSGDAVALVPNAQLTVVTRNVMYGNDAGVYLGGDTKFASSDNQVVKNIIAASTRFAVHSSWPGSVGRKNTISGNCFWASGSANIAGIGASRNIVQDPGFADPPRSFFFKTKGACYVLRPASYKDEPSGSGTKPTKPPTALPTIGSVDYKLGLVVQSGGGFGNEVAFVFIDRVPKGAQVVVRCLSGCHGAETLTARGTSVTTEKLVSLRPPVTLLVTITRSGFVGLSQQITIRAARPNGVSAAERQCIAVGKSGPPKPCLTIVVK